MTYTRVESSHDVRELAAGLHSAAQSRPTEWWSFSTPCKSVVPVYRSEFWDGHHSASAPASTLVGVIDE